jgi:hypothetical protein
MDFPDQEGTGKNSKNSYLMKPIIITILLNPSDQKALKKNKVKKT